MSVLVLAIGTGCQGPVRRPDPADDAHWSPGALFGSPFSARWPRPFSESAEQPGPSETEALQDLEHPDPTRRRAALQAIARQPQAAALRQVQRALVDHDVTVRLAAIETLGQRADDQASRALQQLLQHDGERIREAAVGALANHPENQDVVYAAAEDRSWRVRAAVADALGDGSPAAVPVAARLIADPSPEVQARALERVGHWPPALAIPLLLDAASSPNYRSRKISQTRLAEHWPAAGQLLAQTADPQQPAALERLRQQWDRGADPATLGLPQEGPQGTGELQAAAAAAERMGIHKTRPAVAAEGLPGQEHHGHLYHTSAEVRRRACRRLQAQPDPGHAKMLLPLLEDRDRSVQYAAVRALGECGPLEDLQPLEQLLTAPDWTLRVQAASALCRLGSPNGPAALERLARHLDPAVQRQAVAAMGQLHDPLFLPTLIQLLDDQPSVQRAALLALPQVVGQDINQQQPPTANAAQQAENWKVWYQRGG